MPFTPRRLFSTLLLGSIITIAGCGGLVEEQRDDDRSIIGVGAPTGASDAGKHEHGNTVLWISIDGVRPDYIDRGQTPTLDRLMREGAYSRELVPVFPSLTFPTHVSQATGVKAREHGVTGNSFVDIERERTYRYPPWANLMQAEPIWLTASRQGVRAAVIDWPLSHAQRERRGRPAAEYFGQRFERGLTDRQRIEQLIEAWDRDEKRGDSENPPLRLLMGYVLGPDAAGHEFGPDAPEPVARLEETDALLGEAIERAIEIWQRDNTGWQASERAQPTSALWVILSTDHGMSAVHTLVHPGHLAQLHDVDDVETVSNANIAHLFFRDRQTKQNDPARVASMVERISAHEFATAWRRSDLPPKWEYDHPSRTGDIVIVLDTGYTFSTRPAGLTGDAAEHGGPLGMHGYDPRTNPEMYGLLVVWRYPQPLNVGDLGRVHSLHLHATAARLLEIDPAEGAKRDVIDVLFIEEGSR